MKCFKALTFFFVCVVAANYFPTSQCGFEIEIVGFIETTCEKTPNPNLCISILKSDPRGSTADTTGLALILVDKIKGKAKETISSIKALYGQTPELRRELDTCKENYDAILKADVPEAEQALALGNPKFAENGVVDAAMEAVVCERGFGGNSPLTGLTKAMQDLSDIARAIVRMLL